MPIAGSLLVAALVAGLIAGCSESVDSTARQSETTSSSAPPRTRSPSPSKPTAAAPPSTAPAAGVPIAEVITFIEAGKPADAAGYHSADRDGTITQLGEDVAFTTPSGKTTCVTDTKYAGGALTCLVDLTNPPPRPPGASEEGPWKGGWVDFDGTSVEVGSIHGDPGPFVNGKGHELPYGQSLAFGDFRCRSDQAGLYCVNYAHQSAVWYSDAGIEKYACAKQINPPPDIGIKYVC
jgi:hypothetical protein